MLICMKLLLRWGLLACALVLVAHLYPGVKVTSFGSALVAALVLGLLNTSVRPILILLTLPVTLLTLGLFLFVINALMFWAEQHRCWRACTSPASGLRWWAPCSTACARW